MTPPQKLFELLEDLGVATRTVTHPPVYTVEDSRRLRGNLPGGHCKSLLLKDKDRKLWLVVALEHRQIDLKRLRRDLGARKGLSFASRALLEEVLGVEPGSVTPFAVMNDSEGRVHVVLDRGMLDIDPLNYHPLRNDRTTAISPADLLRFLDACAHEPTVLDF